MKILKIIVGTIAGLFALAHIISLASNLITGSINFSSAYAAGQIGGSVLGICLGTAIAIACFRKKKV